MDASPGPFAKPIGNPFDEPRLLVEPGDFQRGLALGVAGREVGSVLDEQGQRFRNTRTCPKKSTGER